MQFIQTTEEGKLVGFMALNDYPNPPYLPSYDWEQWMEDKYG